MTGMEDRVEEDLEISRRWEEALRLFVNREGIVFGNPRGGAGVSLCIVCPLSCTLCALSFPVVPEDQNCKFGCSSPAASCFPLLTPVLLYLCPLSPTLALALNLPFNAGSPKRIVLTSLPLSASESSTCPGWRSLAHLPTL